MTIPKNQDYYNILLSANAPLTYLALYETLNHSAFTIGDVAEIPIDEFDDLIILEYNTGVFGRFNLVCLNSFSLELLNKTYSLELTKNHTSIEQSTLNTSIEINQNNNTLELTANSSSLEL